MAAMTPGEQLRYRILKYMREIERRPGGKLPELGEIAEHLGVSEDDTSDQLDVLDSDGAVKANRTIDGGAAPMLTGRGKALFEELQEKHTLSGWGGRVPEEATRNLTAGGSSEEPGEALGLFDRIVLDMYGSFDLVGCFRRCLVAVRLLGWSEGEDWIRKELNGYPSDEVPPWRSVPGSIEWVGAQVGDRIQLIAQSTVSPDPELQSRPATVPLRTSLARMVMAQENGFGDRTGRKKEVYVGGKSVTAYEVRRVPPSSVKLALDGISERLFDYASAATVTLKSGDVAASVFQRYKTVSDQRIANLGIDNHLRTAYLNLSQDNPASWQAAVLACRNIVNDLSEKLWQSTDAQYPYLTSPDRKPLRVTRDKELNRIRAYLHQKGALRKNEKILKAQLEWLANLVSAIYSEASSGKHSISYDDAQSILINTYVFLGEIARLTDFEPLVTVRDV